MVAPNTRGVAIFDQYISETVKDKEAYLLWKMNIKLYVSII